jgi:hypothetical protein
MNEQTSQNETDLILEQLRPRMRSARIGHIRRMVGGVALVPLLAVSAAAMASTNGGTSEVETAHSIPEDTVSDVELPDAGDADGADGTDAKVEEATTSTAAPTTTVLPDQIVHDVDLGELGTAEVEETLGGEIKALSYGLTEGWEVISAEFDGEHLVVVIANGALKKEIIIKPGLHGELSVIVEEVLAPTTTTVAPEPKPVAPVIVDRFVVEVPGKGSFVVEREGDTLWVGDVTVNDGHTYEVIKAEGWKVYVGFLNGEHIWYGKALINDNNEVEIHRWDEAIASEPVYQWVEIAEVGAAKFKLYDGQLRVKELAPSAGFEAWDYNEGAPASTAKVDFEGEGQVWFIEAWINEAGDMDWNSYQGD